MMLRVCLMVRGEGNGAPRPLHSHGHSHSHSDTDGEADDAETEGGHEGGNTAGTQVSKKQTGDVI